MDPYQRCLDACTRSSGEQLQAIGFFQPRLGTLSPAALAGRQLRPVERLVRLRSAQRSGWPPLTCVALSATRIYVFGVRSHRGAVEVTELLLSADRDEASAERHPECGTLGLTLPLPGEGRGFELEARADITGARRLWSILQRQGNSVSVEREPYLNQPVPSRPPATPRSASQFVSAWPVPHQEARGV
jgi:hypothetical protein